jgi:predicted enzyme related to lactoylglutathione lyase
VSAEAQEIAHPVNWWEVEVTDLERAGAFYSAVFGWSMRPFGADAMFAMRGESMVCGLVRGEGPPQGRGVKAYLETTDMEATLGRVESAGGAVVHRRALVADDGSMGWWALFTDPSGVTLGLWTGNPPT